jgi:hypothetical protein
LETSKANFRRRYCAQRSRWPSCTNRLVEAHDVLASALEGFVGTTEMREIGEALALSRLAKDRFRSEGG